jgi:hypothetical protein
MAVAYHLFDEFNNKQLGLRHSEITDQDILLRRCVAVTLLH